MAPGPVAQGFLCIALSYWLGVAFQALAGARIYFLAVAVGLALVLASTVTWLVELLILSRQQDG